MYFICTQRHPSSSLPPSALVFPFLSSYLVGANSLGLLVLVISVLGLHLLDEGDVLLLGLVGVAAGVLDGLLPGALLCLALLSFAKKNTIVSMESFFLLFLAVNM